MRTSTLCRSALTPAIIDAPDPADPSNTTVLVSGSGESLAFNASGPARLVFDANGDLTTLLLTGETIRFRPLTLFRGLITGAAFHGTSVDLCAALS